MDRVLLDTRWCRSVTTVAILPVTKNETLLTLCNVWPGPNNMNMAFVLHVSPGKWDLPSIDPSCLAAIIFLQLAIPGKFSILECSNPDTSPSGR